MRAMLAEDVRLDLVSRAQRAGRRDVSTYFTNYSKVDDWHLVPAWIDRYLASASSVSLKVMSPWPEPAVH